MRFLSFYVLITEHSNELAAQHAVVHHALSLFFLWSTAIESIRHTNVLGALFILAKSSMHNQLKIVNTFCFVTGLE
jgi:hypothetical protein